MVANQREDAVARAGNCVKRKRRGSSLSSERTTTGGQDVLVVKTEGLGDYGMKSAMHCGHTCVDADVLAAVEV